MISIVSKLVSSYANLQSPGNQDYSPVLWLSICARYFFTLTSFTTQVNTFMASSRSDRAGKEGAMRMLLSWGSLPEG